MYKFYTTSIKNSHTKYKWCTIELNWSFTHIITFQLGCSFWLSAVLYINICLLYPSRISGANTGLGKATALELARRGARVVLACRDDKKGDAVARNIKKKTKNSNVYSMRLDLASLNSIRDFVEYFNEKESHLHILINNAGKSRMYFLICIFISKIRKLEMF